jgi:hypothetical protein
MALVGTISGSSAGMRTAVTGGLIIANAPGASFPTLPPDAILFVSGTVSGPDSRSVFGGQTVICGSLFLGNGTVTVSDNNVPVSIFSSGNIVARLDVNNDGVGHVFDVQNYQGDYQLRVSETGNVDVSGSLVVSGNTSLVTVVERLFPTTSNGGVLSFNMTDSAIFHVNNPLTSNITANFINLPVTNNRVWTPTIILSQSATARIINAVQIAGTAFKLNWANNVEPTGNASKHDVFGFSLIRSGANWTVLGQMSTYG